MNWVKLGHISGPFGRRLKSLSTLDERLERLGEVLLAGEGAQEKDPKTAIESEVRHAWGALPLVVRLPISTSRKDHRSLFPKQVDLAPPFAKPELRGRQGSFLLLDLTRKPIPVLTIVLFDWDELTIPSGALRVLGLVDTDLVALLMKHRFPNVRTAEMRPRWDLQLDNDLLTVRSGSLNEGGASPRVGRMALGPSYLSDGQLQLRLSVEVLALPRLGLTSHRDGVLVPLGARDGARSWLRATVWRCGVPQELLAMLQLANRSPLTIDEERVRMQACEDPSPLVWLALADALKLAAEQQRRQYVRVNEDARAPVGTLRANAYVANLARARSDIVPVTRHVYSTDTLENRLFKGMCGWVRRQIPKDGPLGVWVAERFSRIETRFPKAKFVEPALWMCRDHTHGTSPVLQAARDQCEAVLSGRYPGLHFDGDSLLEMRSFEMDIASLFEAAARTVLAQAADRTVLDGNVAKVTHALRWVGPETGTNQLKPDFVVVGREGVVAVADAKYKRRRHKDSTFKPLGGSDFHQISTYMLAWPQAAWGVVLMPKDGDQSEGPASKLLATLHVPTRREVGVFEVSPAQWVRTNVENEPLSHWVRKRSY